MAVVGIVMKVFQIVISVSIGMAAGCIPIVGYNMGAGEKKRVRGLFLRLILSEAAVGAVALFFALDGVLYSMPVSDILTGVISAVLIVKTCRELR